MALRFQVVLGVVLFVGCGQAQQAYCDATNCEGCCDFAQSSRGTCTAISASSCGAKGEQCNACATGQECVAGTCDFVPDQLPAGAKYVFVTSATFDGNLGGLTGADQKCQAAGAGANLGSTFVAWVSDLNDVANDPSRPTVNAVDRVTGNGPWYLPCRDGQKKLIRAFNNKAQLGGTPLVSLNCSEQGVSLAGGTVGGVWTGTSSGGTAKNLQDSSGHPQSNCHGWKDNDSASSLAQGSAGTVNDPPANWTDVGADYCVSRYHLYCFQN